MEHQKKKTEIKNGEDKQEEKQRFFKQVLTQCCSNFKKKELQFFYQCIVPHGVGSGMNSLSNKKLRNSNQDQKQLNINDINPNVLTMDRNVLYYEEKKMNHFSTQKPNRRILTTPTQKMKKEIKLQNYQDFTFYKKMKQYDKSISVSNNSKRHPPNIQCKYNKVYLPEPLFHPSSFVEPPKIILNVSSRKVGRLCQTRRQDRKKLTENSKIQFDEAIPDTFAQILKRPINLTTYRPQRTYYPKSMR